MSSASDKRPPLASVADDGRALVLDSGWAASRDAAGNWARGIKFWADDLYELFTIVPDDAAASALCKDARAALVADAAISFPEGSKFFNVEGIPVAVAPGKAPPSGGTGKWPTATAFPPGKPAHSFPWSSVMRNGSPCTEAEFRADAGLLAEPPHEFPEGTWFANVEGNAVSVDSSRGATGILAWDDSGPRPFPMDSVLRNGAEFSEAEFRALVASNSSAKTKRQASP